MRTFRNLFGLLEKKEVPPIDVVNERTREGLPKAYIPKFLYKPPFGYPRYVDLPNVRRLASMPYVEMCLTTIIDEASSVPWDIIVKEGIDVTPRHEEEIKHVKSFYENPNTNKESFNEIRRKYIRDILEVDAGVIIKMFNLKEEMVEIMARDGATFTKNPDIFGRIVDRDDLILETNITTTSKEAQLMEPGWINAVDAREKAAYFQYGWITGARPVPFGKREIVWMERNPRTDSIYGRSPVEILANTIQTLIYAIEHNLEYFNDNSIPKGIIGLEGSNTDEIKAFKDQWVEQQRVKDNAGNWKKRFHQIPIVGHMPKFERLQFTNAELELIESQKWWAKMVWACFGVTSTELGYTEDAKGMANQIVQSDVFRKRAINPILRIEEYKHNHEILPEFYNIEKNKFIREESKRLENKGIAEVKALEEAELKAEEKLKKGEFPYQDLEFKFMMFNVDEDMKKANLYKLQIDSGIKTVNEIRVEEGLEEVEWGDEDPKRNQGNNINFGSNPLEDEKRRKEKESKPSSKKEDEKKKSEKKAYQDNPLILRENEVMNEEKLERSIVYLLRQNEKKIIALLEKEVGKNKLSEIKSIDDIAKAIKNLITFQGLKRISDAVIQNTFVDGWDDSEKQLDRNLMVNKDAISFIQDYTFKNIKGMTEDIIDNLRQELERGIMNGEGITKIKARVSKVFDVGENRAEMIARTETNRAENQGKLIAMKESGEKMKKFLIITHDKRTSEISKALGRKYGTAEQAIPINDTFSVVVNGKEISGTSPPFHINERDALVFTR